MVNVMTMTARLQELWSKVLDQDEADIEDDDSFFEIGGDSVAALRLVSLAQESNIGLDADVVFQFPKLGEMAARVTCNSGNATEFSNGIRELDPDLAQSCAEKCGIDVDTVEDVYPCPMLQMRFLQAHIAAKQPGALIEILILAVEGTQDVSRIQNAFEIIRQRNDILRTRFVALAQGPFQVVVNDRIEWNTDSNLTSYLEREKNTRFALGLPLTRYGVINDNGKASVVWTAPHCVEDEWSRKLLLDDLEECLSEPDEFSRKPSRPSFRLYSEYQISKKEEAMAFWKQYLDGAELECSLLAIQPDYTPVLNQEVHTNLPGPQLAREGFTVPILAHVAFTLAIFELCGHPDNVVFQTARMGRQIPVKGVDATMGQIISPVFLNVPANSETLVRDLLRKIQKDSSAMMRYEHYAMTATSSFMTHFPLFSWHPQGVNTVDRQVRYRNEDGGEVFLKPSRYPHTYNFPLHVVGRSSEGDSEIETHFDDTVIERGRTLEFVELFIKLLRELMNVELGVTVGHLLANRTNGQT
ncbi:MAG: hypothetical protein Q9201_002130 [Fulgogasparrea decipioides]